jgi:tRNA threonylcarbamoyladenosine biosynthesis protein TsaE
LHPADDNHRELKLHLTDDGSTAALGAALAKCLRPGMAIYLSGELGAGKTTVARGLIRALGHKGAVKSPTYALVEPYVISGLYLYHFDFYRFIESRELRDAGLAEYFNETSVCLVEWPEKVRDLPAPDLAITLQIDEAGGRNAVVKSATANGNQCIESLQQSQ